MARKRKPAHKNLKYYSAGTKLIRVKFAPIAENALIIITPKKFGIAVTRNRIRRRIKESIRLLLGNKRKAGEMVVFPDITIKTCDFQTIKAELEHCFRSLGLLASQ